MGEHSREVFLLRLKYVKFSICDMLRLSHLCLFHHCCAFAHRFTKMPSCRMCEDEKTRKRLHLPSSANRLTKLKSSFCCLLINGTIN